MVTSPRANITAVPDACSSGGIKIESVGTDTLITMVSTTLLGVFSSLSGPVLNQGSFRRTRGLPAGICHVQSKKEK